MKNTYSVNSASYLGISGSFSHIAAKLYFKKKVEPRGQESAAPNHTGFRGAEPCIEGHSSADRCRRPSGTWVKLVGQKTASSVLDKVKSENSIFGILPIENSVSGSVIKNYDLLLEKKLKIVGELYLRIKHNLLAKQKLPLERIKTIHSHPEAFKQCARFLEKLKAQKASVNDTATAACLISEKGSETDAAIASLEAARLYRLTIVKTGIETDKKNFTRFVIVSNRKQVEINKNFNKASVVFTLKHAPGTLYNALGVMANRGLNLTKIESRPIVGKPFEYRFFVDFEFDKPKYAEETLIALRNFALTIRLLGIYKRGKFYER